MEDRHRGGGGASSSRMIPFGNIYRSRARILPAASVQQQFGKVSTRRHVHEHSSEDVSSMTIESLRGRLLAERTAARGAKDKIEELEKKVQRLERSLQMEIQKRLSAESALQDSLEKLLSSGRTSSCMSTDSELDTLSKEERVVVEKGKDMDVKLSCSKVLKLPCAASLEPQTRDSDSDWSRDDEELKERECESEIDTHQSLPYKLHLSQLDLARKIGRSLTEWRNRHSQTSQEMKAELVQRHEDHLQQQQQEKEESKVQQEAQTLVPYVSFSKYLKLDRFVALGTDQGEGALWGIKGDSGRQPAPEKPISVRRTSDRERMDEILHALESIELKS